MSHRHECSKSSKTENLEGNDHQFLAYFTFNV